MQQVTAAEPTMSEAIKLLRHRETDHDHDETVVSWNNP